VYSHAKSLARFFWSCYYFLGFMHSPTFTPNADTGDFLIVINSATVRMTGNKMTDRPLVRYTGHPGGQRHTTPAEILEKKPNYLIEHAVKGMLPKGSLGRKQFGKLFVYDGVDHPHAAQKPKNLV
jgi:large subunit ribosomal protein L13